MSAKAGLLSHEYTEVLVEARRLRRSFSFALRLDASSAKSSPRDTADEICTADMCSGDAALKEELPEYCETATCTEAECCDTSGE